MTLCNQSDLLTPEQLQTNFDDGTLSRNPFLLAGAQYTGPFTLVAKAIPNPSAKCNVSANSYYPINFPAYCISTTNVEYVQNEGQTSETLRTYSLVTDASTTIDLEPNCQTQRSNLLLFPETKWN